MNILRNMYAGVYVVFIGFIWFSALVGLFAPMASYDHEFTLLESIYIFWCVSCLVYVSGWVYNDHKKTHGDM